MNDPRSTQSGEEQEEERNNYRYSDDVDADDLGASVASTLPGETRSQPHNGFRDKLGLSGIGRRTLGISFLLITVFLWTLSNFLASSLFSDSTYNKPFFVVYVNSSFFALSLVPRLIIYIKRNGKEGVRRDLRHLLAEYRRHGTRIKTMREEEEATATERLLDDVDDETTQVEPVTIPQEKLGFRETMALSLEFSMLWFLANYFASACFEYTSVASGTILTSTSSVWTLIFCAVGRLEGFTLRKLFGVLASIGGVILVSTVDLSENNDENRGSFPHKSPGELLIGNGMAFVSAVIYGLYVTVMKGRVGDEDRVDMQLFFGLVGLFNLTLLWPIFFLLHFTGLEPFEMPSTTWIWAIILTNSLSSFISDISWALAMLLTTPLVVTVGLSLTIPLSLVGEMLQYGQYSSFMYWMGALVVFMSFLFINHESHDLADQKHEELEDEEQAGNVV